MTEKYVDKLLARLPGKVHTPLDNSVIEAVCCVIGMAEYCVEAMPVLAEQLLMVTSSGFQDRVTFQDEQELLGNLMNHAIGVRVNSVSRSLDEALFDVFKVFQKVMEKYVDKLVRRLPGNAFCK